MIVDRTIEGYENRASYRDVALYFQDEDNIIGTSFMPYVQNVAGLTGVNYRAEPYLHREEAGCSLGPDVPTVPGGQSTGSCDSGD